MFELTCILMLIATIFVLAWYISQLRERHARKIRRQRKVKAIQRRYDTENIPDDMTMSYIIGMD